MWDDVLTDACLTTSVKYAVDTTQISLGPFLNTLTQIGDEDNDWQMQINDTAESEY